MADNVQFQTATLATPPSATLVAAEQHAVTLELYQKVKVVDGTAGSTTGLIVTAGGAAKVDGSAVTQPVSGTVTTSPPANASENLAQVAGTATDVNSGLKSAGTIRVVIATDQPALTNKLLVTPDSVALPANQSVNVSQINAVTPLMGNGVTGTGSPRVTIASDNTAFAVNATGPTLTKGTQGSTGFSTQDLKDSGRVSISFTAEFSPAAVAEAMLTMSVSKDGATATTGTSYAITSGKRLRIASKSIAVENTLGTSIQRAYLRTRFAATGGALITSPLQANCIAAAAGTVKSIGSNFDDYPDGLEFLGDGTKAIGWSLQAPDWVSATSTLKVYITIICFEY